MALQPQFLSGWKQLNAYSLCEQDNLKGKYSFISICHKKH